MSRKIIKCAKCQNNAETQPNRSEYTTTYPIRDKDGKIYCWDCYKNKSHCKGCQKSVANIKFPRSGQPEYPHCNGGVSYNCERISNKVEFICSKSCSKKLADQKYQNWKEKLNQGWNKCEECWNFWMGLKSKEEGWEWLEEEKNQWKVIKLAQPGQGKLCLDHKNWEEGGKQRYEVENAQFQKDWERLTCEDRLKEVKKAYRADDNLTELANREKIPGLVLHRWSSKACHKRFNCPDCHFDKEDNSPCDNNLSCSSHGNNSRNDNSEGKGRNDQSQENLKQENKNKLGNDHSGLIIGGIVIASLISLATVLAVRNKKNKK